MPATKQIVVPTTLTITTVEPMATARETPSRLWTPFTARSNWGLIATANVTRSGLNTF